MSVRLQPHAASLAKAFTAQDRCDRCGAQAQVRATFAAGDLLFCGHHGRVLDVPTTVVPFGPPVKPILATIYIVVAHYSGTYGEGTDQHNVSIHGSLEGAREVLRQRVLDAMEEDDEERAKGRWHIDEDDRVDIALEKFLTDATVMSIYWRECGSSQPVGYSIDTVDVEV